MTRSGDSPLLEMLVVFSVKVIRMTLRSLQRTSQIGIPRDGGQWNPYFVKQVGESDADNPISLQRNK